MSRFVLVLVFALVANAAMYEGLWLSRSGPAGSKAYAAAGDVILLWDTANGAVPAGWTSISSNPGDAFYGVFPRAAATYGAATAGSDTHTQGLTYVVATQGANGTALGNAGAVAAINTHTHTWGAPVVGTGDVRPPFQNLVFIMAPGPTEVPANAIAIFDTASLPAGWTRYAALDGLYLRGFGDNAAGGAASHTHTVDVTSGTSGATVADSGNGGAAANDHTHTISSSITAASNAPSFVDVIFAYNSSGAPVPLTDGMFALFDAAPPANWTTVSGSAPWSGNFLRGAAAFGATGGSASHDHGASAVLTSGNPSASATNRGTTGASTAASNTHTHNVTYSVDAQPSFPLYRDVIVAKYATPSAGGSLLHNSDSTGSSKWGGSWGVAGGRYGEITCETCHVKSTANIKRIKDTVIAAPNTPTNKFPAEVGTIAPVFSRVSGAAGTAGVMGDDSTNPRASSNKICEVCHTYDAAGTNGVKYHAYSGGTNDPAHQNNAKDCTGCHKHTQGFKAPACDSCHGNPPTTATAGGPTGLANSPYPTGSATAGAHAAHAVALGYDCSNCHNNQNMPQLSTVPTLSNKGDISIGFSNWGSATGAYSGQSNVSYNNVAGTGTKTCSSVYCHGSTINPVSNPVWDGAVACGSCHKAFAYAPPTLGSHQKHAGSATGEQNLACSKCHGASAGAAGHVGGTVSWQLDTADGQIGALATYNSASAGDTGTRAPSAGYGNCDNIGCHSSGQSATGAASPLTYGTPSWGGSMTCASCHKNMDTDATAPGDHVKHAQAQQIACATCHSGYTETTVAAGTHNNSTVNVIFSGMAATGLYTGGTTSGNHALGGGYGSCYTVLCHSAGQSVTGGTTPATYGTPSWAGAAMTCASCHRNMDTDSAAPGSHVQHAQTSGIACASCHNGYTETTVAAATHANQTVNLSFSGTAAGTLYTGGTTSGNHALGGGYGTCHTSACHSSGQSATGTASPLTYGTPTWGGTLGCDACHKNMDTDATAPGDHVKHAQTEQIACATCHSGYTETTVAAGTHNNSTVNVVFSGMAATSLYTGGTTSGNHALGGGYGRCYTVLCHSAGQSTSGGTPPASYGTPSWAGAAMTCASCHKNMDTDATAPGSHYQHAQSTSNIACATCHNGYTETTVAPATHANQTVDLSFSGTAAGTLYTGGTTSGNHALGGGYGTCYTNACHGVNAGTWGANTTNDTCTKCHGVGKVGAVKDEIAPGYNGTGLDTGGSTTNSDPEVGAHDTHLRGLNSIVTSTMIQCEDCHVYPATAMAAGHIDTYSPALNNRATITFTTGVHSFNSGTYNPSTYTCSTAYCHGGAMPKGDTSGSNTAPVWNLVSYLTGSRTTDCGRCHGVPPTLGSSAGTHSGKTLANCFECHPETVSNATGTILLSGGKHMNGILEAVSGCTGCHGAAITGGTGENFRDVAADFTQASRHVFGATVKDFDCIVCHAEGDTTSVGQTIKRTSEHTGETGNDNSRSIAMRNVDRTGNPGTGVGPNVFGTWTNDFWKWPKPSTAPTSTDHSNMDKFCMSCHDANGASQVSVHANYSQMSTTRPLTPFSKTTVGGSYTDFGARTRVLDVKSQFNPGGSFWPGSTGALPTTFDTLTEGQSYTGNPSQHAVLGPRYATKNANLTAWTAAKTLKSGQTLATSAETSQLHCADCHTVDTNAHGSATANMMVAATVDDTCYTCHSSAVYTDPAAAGSRVDHAMCGNTFNAGMQAIFGTSFCFNCHGGPKASTPYGAIHGVTSGADPDYAATYSSGKNPVEERYRFMGGMLGAWKTGGAFPGSWTGTGAPNCYMRTAANAYTNCTRHATGATGSKGSTNFDRALKY